MKAILLTRTGDPSVLEYVDMPTPKPAADQVLVKADTIGVSRPEILVRQGVYAWMPPLPAIPGIEMTGTVVERAAEVRGLELGQKVFVTARELPHRAGCYAEYIAVPARAVFPLPENVDMEAAACLSNYQVAYHVLHTAGRCVPGGTAVIDSAAGGTGSAAVQLAKLAGMQVIAIAGGAAKTKALRAFGADHVIDYTDEDPPTRVREITKGEGADLVLDGIGGKGLAQKFPMVGAFGIVVAYGWLQGIPEENLVANLRGSYYAQSPAIRF
ncbi:MAG TPA: zinc-binding dehydrogenase, partial [Xanthobacteraceae bacterium]|nr:zinc-binding dehydrogenase [Xanthobacteraceae bacterium]